MCRTRIGCLVAFVFITLYLGASAKAQLQAISEYTYLGHALFCEQDVAALDKAATLSPEQKDAVSSLMRGAMLRARTIQGRFNRATGEKWEKITESIENPENYQEAYKKYEVENMKESRVCTRQIAAVEREALGDIRAVLKPQQIEKGWAEFERSRRRMIASGGMYGDMLGDNPTALVKAAKLDETDMAAVEPILARYDLALDPLLIPRMKAIAQANEKMAESGEMDPNYWTRPELMRTPILQLNTRTVIEIEKALSEDGQRAFLRQRASGDTFSNFSPPSWDYRVRQIVDLVTLTPEQQDRLDILTKKADDAAFQLVLTELRERDDANLRDPEPTPPTPATPPAPGEPPPRNEKADKAAERMKKFRAVTTALIKDIRALLTPAQLEDFDSLAVWGSATEDPFKIDRTHTPTSPWLRKPKKLSDRPAPSEDDDMYP